MIISDEAVQVYFDFLKTSELEHAQAKANFKSIEKHEKPLLARLKHKCSSKQSSDRAQERDAYRDHEYTTWENGYKEALLKLSLIENQRENAMLAIEIWRTDSANQRRL